MTCSLYKSRNSCRKEKQKNVKLEWKRRVLQRPSSVHSRRRRSGTSNESHSATKVKGIYQKLHILKSTKFNTLGIKNKFIPTIITSYSVTLFETRNNNLEVSWILNPLVLIKMILAPPDIAVEKPSTNSVHELEDSNSFAIEGDMNRHRLWSLIGIGLSLACEAYILWRISILLSTLLIFTSCRACARYALKTD